MSNYLLSALGLRVPEFTCCCPTHRVSMRTIRTGVRWLWSRAGSIDCWLLPEGVKYLTRPVDGGDSVIQTNYVYTYTYNWKTNLKSIQFECTHYFSTTGHTVPKRAKRWQFRWGNVSRTYTKSQHTLLHVHGVSTNEAGLQHWCSATVRIAEVFFLLHITQVMLSVQLCTGRFF